MIENDQLVDDLLSDLIMSAINMRVALRENNQEQFYEDSKEFMYTIESLKIKAGLATPMKPKPPKTLLSRGVIVEKRERPPFVIDIDSDTDEEW